jgi:hypothetical protein
VPHRSQPFKKPSSVYPKREAKGPAHHAPPSAPFLIGATAIRTAEIARKTDVTRRYTDCHLAAQIAAPVGSGPEKFVAVPNMNRSRTAFLTCSSSQTEIAVTRSKQTAEEFLTGARTRIWPPFTLNICEGGRFSGIACWLVPRRFFAAPNISRSPSALLTGTDSQTETAVNHSKQTGGDISNRNQNAHFASLYLSISERGRFSGIAFSTPQ